MTGNGTITARDPAVLDQEREAQLAAALARCAAGDRAALQVIYNSEAPRMIGVARRILFRQDLAEEAVHDAFIRIWRGAAGFDPHRGSARGWLYAVVRNRALSIHRNEHRYDSSSEGAEDLDCEVTLSRLPETSALRRCLEQIDRPPFDNIWMGQTGQTIADLTMNPGDVRPPSPAKPRQGVADDGAVHHQPDE